MLNSRDSWVRSLSSLLFIVCAPLRRRTSGGGQAHIEGEKRSESHRLMQLRQENCINRQPSICSARTWRPTAASGRPGAGPRGCPVHPFPRGTAASPGEASPPGSYCWSTVRGRPTGVWQARCRAAGLNVLITNTVRDREYQEYLYQQGRTRPGNIVTNGRTPTFHSDKAGSPATGAPARPWTPRFLRCCPAL